jgi:hypothetical protein
MLPKRKGNRQSGSLILGRLLLAALLIATFDSLPSGLKECYHNEDRIRKFKAMLIRE